MSLHTSAAAALALYLLWAVIAFGVRTVIQLRRSGDSGFRGLSGARGSVEWWAGVLLIAAMLLGLIAPIAQLAGLVEPVSLLDHSLLRWAGAVVALAGSAATFAAQVSMGDSWRVGVDEAERTELVTTGAFRLARNPIFTAMALTGAGLALLAPNVLALGGFAALVVALQLQVRRVEEPYLIAVHGRTYLAYASRVGRFIPGLGRLSSAGIAAPVRETP